MTTAVAALLIMAKSGAASPAEVVSEMFKRYHGAQELHASLKFTLTAGSEGGVVESAIQFRRPDRLYLRQVAKFGSRRDITAIADGKTFTYNMPPAVARYDGQRAVEPQNKMKVEDLYTVVTASLVDKSPILDVLVAKKEHLQSFRDQLATLQFESEGGANEGENHVIVGNWRMYQKADVSGRYRLVVSPKYDFVSFATQETLTLPNNQSVKVTSVWEAQVIVGSVKDEKLFSIPK